MSGQGDDELLWYERHARHLALPELGRAGVERLTTLRFALPESAAAPWPTVHRALTRLGAIAVSDGADVLLSDEPMLAPNSAELFLDRSGVWYCQLGPLELSAPRRVEASAPLAMKQLWLGSLLASELAWWAAQPERRPLRWTFDYPEYRRASS